LNVKQLNFVAQKLGYEDHEKEKKIEGKLLMFTGNLRSEGGCFSLVIDPSC
jgi:hypothetical protein